MKYLLKTVLRPTLFFPLAIVLLAVVGYLLFNQAIGYSYLSPEHLDDIMLTKLWSMLWLFASALAVYLVRKRPFAPALAVLALSIYFVILYGLLFRGTEYGMNGHWGDNGNRMAEICKMMAYNTFFTDWYLKDLPSFYPPMWFAIMAVYAKLLSIEAYQTIKFGYLLIFLVYPWLIYHFWRKLVSPTAAAAVAIATLFFAYKYIDWTYYEHITAALFIPWWLYYFEGVTHGGKQSQRDWKYYSAGSLIGGMLFMTYYYWFFMAIAAFPITIIARFVATRSFKEVWNDIRHKAVLTAGVVIVSAVYWFPLLRKMYWWYTDSAQNAWFHLDHSDLTGLWTHPTLEVFFIMAGIAFAAYLWDQFGKAKLLYFFFGGLILILIDRYLNLGETSIQTRKILEFAHVFTAAPLAIGIVAVWLRIRRHVPIARGITALLLLTGLITVNAQTEMYRSDYYKKAVTQVVPESDLDVFRAVETKQTVFLTNNYIGSCYLPYYLFIPYYNMTSHPAGRYSQRELFLDGAVTVTEPELLAYILRYNRYSPVNYVFLPRNDSTGRFMQTLYQAGFNDHIGTFKNIYYSVDPDDAPSIFIEKHDRGIYALSVQARSEEMDEIIKLQYPSIYWHLKPMAWTTVLDKRITDQYDVIYQPQTFVNLPLERLPNMNTNVDIAQKYIEPLDSDSIELFDYRGSTSYHPVNLIHRIQMFIASYHKTNDSLFLRRAQKYTDKLLSLSYKTDSSLFLPYGFRYAVHSDSSNTFETPWYSGMAQGEFLMVLARLFEITNDEKYLLAGEKTLNSLAIIRRSGKKPWVSRIDNNGYFWIEEYPHETNPGLTLNGYMAAVYGLYDYYRVTKTPLAKELYDLSLTTIKHYLPSYRVSGNNSWYCLGHNHRATDGYHQLHINMLINLSNMTGDPFFRTMKDLFEADQQSDKG